MEHVPYTAVLRAHGAWRTCVRTSDRAAELAALAVEPVRKFRSALSEARTARAALELALTESRRAPQFRGAEAHYTEHLRAEVQAEARASANLMEYAGHAASALAALDAALAAENAAEVWYDGVRAAFDAGYTARSLAA